MSEETRYHVPLLLCCAEDNEVALVKVVDALHKEGMAPEVVAGVDVDASLLGAVVDRTEGPALFVLCQSEQLDKNQTRRLAGLFSARSGSDQQIITVTLNPTRPLSILPSIRNGMKSVTRARYRDPDADDPGSQVSLREVVGPLSVSALPRDDQLPDLDGIDDTESLARQLHEEMVAAEAILSKRAGPSADAAANDAGATERGESTSARGSGSPPEALVPEPGAPAAAVESDSSARALVEIVDNDISDDDLAADTAPDGKSGEDTGPQRVAPTEGTGRSRLMFIVAAAGVAGLALMAVVQMQDAVESETGGPRGIPNSSAVSAGTQTEKGDAKAAQGHDVDAPETGEPSPPPDEPVAADDTSGQAADETGSKSSRQAPPPPPPTDPEVKSINEAIASGRMRALDTLLVLPPSEETMTWDSAAKLCRGRFIAGAGGWRLPTYREIRQLRRARMIPPGSYWTREKGETDDEAIAFDSRRGKKVVWLTVEPNGQAACVRKR